MKFKFSKFCYYIVIIGLFLSGCVSLQAPTSDKQEIIPAERFDLFMSQIDEIKRALGPDMQPALGENGLLKTLEWLFVVAQNCARACTLLNSGTMPISGGVREAVMNGYSKILNGLEFNCVIQDLQKFQDADAACDFFKQFSKDLKNFLMQLRTNVENLHKDSSPFKLGDRYFKCSAEVVISVNDFFAKNKNTLWIEKLCKKFDMPRKQLEMHSKSRKFLAVTSMLFVVFVICCLYEMEMLFKNYCWQDRAQDPLCRMIRNLRA